MRGWVKITPLEIFFSKGARWKISIPHSSESSHQDDFRKVSHSLGSLNSTWVPFSRMVIALPAVEFLVLRYFPLLPKMFSYYRVGPKKLKYLVSKQMRKEDIKLIFKVDYVFDYFWNVVNNTWEERMAIDEFWGVWTAMQWLAFCLISLSALDLGHCLGVKQAGTICGTFV